MSSLWVRVLFVKAMTGWNEAQCAEALSRIRQLTDCSTTPLFLKKLLFTTNGDIGDKHLLSIIQHNKNDNKSITNKNDINNLLDLENNILANIATYMCNNDMNSFGTCNRRLYIDTYETQFNELLLNEKTLDGILNCQDEANRRRYRAPKHLTIDMNIHRHFAAKKMDTSQVQDQDKFEHYFNDFAEKLHNGLNIIASLDERLEIVELKHDAIYLLCHLPIAQWFSPQSKLKQLNIDLGHPREYLDLIVDQMNSFEKSFPTHFDCKIIECIQYSKSNTFAHCWNADNILKLSNLCHHLLIDGCERKCGLINHDNKDKFGSNIDTITMVETIPLCQRQLNMQRFNIQTLNLFNAQIEDLCEILNDKSNVECINIQSSLLNLCVEWSKHFNNNNIDSFDSLLSNLFSKFYLKQLNKVIILINGCHSKLTSTYLRLIDKIFDNLPQLNKQAFEHVCISLQYINENAQTASLTLEWNAMLNIAQTKQEWVERIQDVNCVEYQFPKQKYGDIRRKYHACRENQKSKQ